jgi:hypothetical protein
MNSPEESRLRTRFANLREDDRSATPPFQGTAAAAAARSRRSPAFRIALAALPVLAIALMLAVRTHRSPDAAARDLAAWSSPTAFLLETPGMQILNQTPRLGEQSLPAAPDGLK